MPANTKKTKNIALSYARMWPRELFDIVDEGKLAVKVCEDLQKPGVYVLYREEQPYYIGKASVSLFRRLHAHANQTTDRYFNLWNYFSAFVVDKKHIDEVEGILIASMPTANSAAPKIDIIPIPPSLSRILRKTRQGRYGRQK